MEFRQWVFAAEECIETLDLIAENLEWAREAWRTAPNARIRRVIEGEGGRLSELQGLWEGRLRHAESERV